MEDALKRLDRLTLDEARMAAAQTLKLAHGIDSQVKVVDDKVTGVEIKLKGVDDKVDTILDGMLGALRTQMHHSDCAYIG